MLTSYRRVSIVPSLGRLRRCTAAMPSLSRRNCLPPTFLPLSPSTGFEFLTQLLIHDSDRVSTLTSCKSRYYALSACCALFKYLETSHSMVFPPKSLKIRYEALEGTCAIGRETARDLELVQNVSEGDQISG
jgi:hypothetical protein